jgi:hypothetical protein
MNVLLMIALMIGAPVIALLLAARFEVKSAAAIANGGYGQGLTHEDTAYALRAVGWFVSGMMAAFLLAMPFIDGAFL